MKISGVYKITNTITGDFYIGSSKDVKKRWADHKCPSTWKRYPNKKLYKDMQKYGVDKFSFEILAEVEEGNLKKAEQEFIEMLKPTYNQMNAKGLNVERQKEYMKEYEKTDKRKKYKAEYDKERYQKYKEEILEQTKQYRESHREEVLKQKKQYNNQLCNYRGETMTLTALSMRFYRAGIEHPTLEAKKYLIKD